MSKLGRLAAVAVLGAGLGGVAFGWTQPRDLPKPETPLPPSVRGVTDEPVRLSDDRPRDEAAVRLSWAAPTETRVNRAAPYALTVTNTSSQAVQKVVVQVRVPTGVTASDTEPAAKSINGVLMWELGTLQPRATAELKLRLAAATRGEITAQAWVTFTGSSAATVAVKEPKLEAFICAPETAEIGSHIPIKYGVKNTGDCRTDKVTVTVAPTPALPVAIVSVFTNTPPGGRGDSLEPGKDISGEITPLADSRGVVEYVVTATGEDGLKSTARAKVKVLAPKLELKVEGPTQLGLTREGKYTVTVKNTGDLEARDVQVLFAPGNGIAPPSAVTLTSYPPQTSDPTRVALAVLKPNEIKKLEFTGTAVTPGDVLTRITATGSHNTKADAECHTLVKGIPGIRMEVIDTIDPVRKGAETVYEVKVSNTGTGTDRNLTLVCELPAGMTLVSADGPVQYLERIGVDFNRPGADKNLSTVTFDPVRELGPKTEVVFKVKVRAEKVGNAKFKATITSDHITAPVTKEESTTVYGE